MTEQIIEREQEIVEELRHNDFMSFEEENELVSELHSFDHLRVYQTPSQEES